MGTTFRSDSDRPAVRLGIRLSVIYQIPYPPYTNVLRFIATFEYVNCIILLYLIYYQIISDYITRPTLIILHTFFNNQY